MSAHTGKFLQTYKKLQNHNNKSVDVTLSQNNATPFHKLHDGDGIHRHNNNSNSATGGAVLSTASIPSPLLTYRDKQLHRLDADVVSEHLARQPAQHQSHGAGVGTVLQSQASDGSAVSGAIHALQRQRLHGRSGSS